MISTFNFCFPMREARENYAHKVKHSNKFKIILKGNAEGGTRTRTAFWARGFSYHHGFRHLSAFTSFSVCGLDDAFSLHVSLYT
jgi:hypothetical protein